MHVSPPASCEWDLLGPLLEEIRREPTLRQQLSNTLKLAHVCYLRPHHQGSPGVAVVESALGPCGSAYYSKGTQG